MGYHIFLAMVLRRRTLGTQSLANKIVLQDVESLLN